MKIKLGLIGFLLISLSGCGKPLPEGKLDYEGYWVGRNLGEFISLDISYDGDVQYYKRTSNTESTSNFPLQEFNGNNFSTGFWIFTGEYEVTEPPHETIDGNWEMVVDGVRLTKQS